MKKVRIAAVAGAFIMAATLSGCAAAADSSVGDNDNEIIEEFPEEENARNTYGYRSRASTRARAGAAQDKNHFLYLRKFR